MSLFPAYTSDSNLKESFEEHDTSSDAVESMETQLLASDEEPAAEARPQSVALPERLRDDDFYLDTKLDPGNLRVSTLYYPGRPQYSAREAPRQRARRRRRYFEAARPADADGDGAELAARVLAYRRLLADAPEDEELWLRFVRFQERCCGDAAALAAAEEAAARLPRSRPLADARLALAARHLPAETFLTELREAIAAEKCDNRRLELWIRLFDTLAGAAGACSATALTAAARAALADLRAVPAAYPRVLFVYGSFLGSAGLWEQLVLLVELVAAMNYPSSPAFPPPADPLRTVDVERRLRDREDEAIASGMPTSGVWARVERLRAAAHWRPAAGAAADELAADPQRAPLPADVADLLLPVADDRASFLLLVQALRLAKVPLLPAAEWVTRAAGAGGGWAASGAEALLAPLRAARRLPPAHPVRAARTAHAAAVVAHFLDPPHYFTDDAGFLGWVNGLWEACCGWVGTDRRIALLCWRLRWLHSLMLLVDSQVETGQTELRRMRSEARAALRRHAGASPLPFAQFARLELVASGRPAARAAALLALRAALRDAAAAPHVRLYVARVVHEVCGAGDAAGAWALACAALGRALPADAALARPPPPDVSRDAYRTCEERCDELERDEEEEAEVSGDALLAALLPAASEWAAARALLAPAPRRAALAARALQPRGRPGAPGRWREQAACALVAAAAADHRAAGYARALAPAFPDNAYLALTAEGAPLWAWAPGAGAEARLAAAAPPRSAAAALAALLPALLRAAPRAWAPREAEAAARAARRAGRGGAGGALLQAARLEAEARRARPAAARALYAALDAAPHAKWLYVRGAAWCGAEAAALADLLLDKQLRLHTLRDELEPCSTPAAPM